jgi:hypothetical protein
MFPLGIETIWDNTFFIPFQLDFYLNLVFQTSYVQEHSCYLKDKMDEKKKDEKKDQQNLFTTERYVLVQILPLHKKNMC